MDWTAQLKLCEAIAHEAHEGQVRDDGDPYITHPQRVAESLSRNPALACAGWLHDVIEDSPITGQDLRERGVEAGVVTTVEALTRQADESYTQFIERCGQCGPAIAVKLADIADNLRDDPPQARQDKYGLARLYLESLISPRIS